MAGTEVEQGGDGRRLAAPAGAGLAESTPALPFRGVLTERG
jgi:hypothetical protein